MRSRSYLTEDTESKVVLGRETSIFRKEEQGMKTEMGKILKILLPK